MGIIFVEYRIDEQKREDFLPFIHSLAEGAPMELYEGSDQPGLFVEIWRGLSEEDYLCMKEARTGEAADEASDSQEDEVDREGANGLFFRRWYPVANYVQGGAGRIHIWRFVRV